jgi:hypothetical protein
MRMFSATLAAIALVFAALPAGANENSTLAVTDAVAGGSTITVQGLLTLGADATEPMTVSTDPQGDARVNAAGYDLGDSTVVADFSGSSPRLIVRQQIFDGVADGDGNPPGQGYSWPIAVDGAGGDPLWLAAGSRGTNFTPADGWWTGLCTAGADGWICGSPVPGSVTSDAITWTVPFNMLQAKPGKTVGAGTAYGGSPRSFVWPSVLVTQSTAPVDSAPAVSSYLIPGLVEAGIASTGVSPHQVAYTASAQFAHRTGEYQLSVSTPSAPGDYTIWVRSCFGDVEEPTCVLGSHPLSI